MRYPSLLLFALALPCLVSAAASAVPVAVLDEEPSAQLALAVPRDSIPYVIVTTKALRPEFHRLAQRHTHDGLRAVVVTLESIRAAYPAGADDAQRIRLFLKDAHRDWKLRWVLLGGDGYLLPSRHVILRLLSGSLMRLPVEQYFARLEGVGPAEDDSLWRGATGADTGPELNVGRAPVRSTAEARTFVTKTLRALEERRAPAERKVLVAAGVLGTRANPLVDLAGLTEHGLVPLMESAGAEVTRMYELSDAWPGSVRESALALFDSLNSGYDIAALYGSGSLGVFIAGGESEPGCRFDQTFAYGLGNESRLTCFAFMSAYVCAPEFPDAIGRALMIAPHGGAVSVLGETYSTYVGLGDDFIRRFFRQLVEGGVVTGGEALSRAESAFATTEGIGDGSLTWLTMALFGDPALPWWSEIAPAPPVVIHGPARPASAQVPDVGGLALGMPSPNPAAKETRIVLSVSALETGAPFEAAVFDLNGRRVRSLESGPAPEGHRTLIWDLRGDDGRPVEPGLYFIRATVGREIQTRRVVVAR